jgi:hypothetical protein
VFFVLWFSVLPSEARNSLNVPVIVGTLILISLLAALALVVYDGFRQ